MGAARALGHEAEGRREALGARARADDHASAPQRAGRRGQAHAVAGRLDRVHAGADERVADPSAQRGEGGPRAHRAAARVEHQRVGARRQPRQDLACGAAVEDASRDPEVAQRCRRRLRVVLQAQRAAALEQDRAGALLPAPPGRMRLDGERDERRVGVGVAEAARRARGLRVAGQARIQAGDGRAAAQERVGGGQTDDPGADDAHVDAAHGRSMARGRQIAHIATHNLQQTV